MAINGREVIAYVNGMYSIKNKRSNLVRKIEECGYKVEDIGSKIDIAVGAHRKNYFDGFKMAIVKI